MPFAHRMLEAYEFSERKPTCNRAGYKLVHTAVAGEFIMNSFSRFSMLIGEDTLLKLSECHIMIFGLGGVGGYAAEAIARSGIGKITLVDFDTVSDTNINRQLCALTDTLGEFKVDVLAKRLKKINPGAEIVADKTRYTKETCDHFFSSNPDYIIDAIDCITDKIQLICNAKERNIPIISSMGTGNKLDATAFRVSDISKTKMCPLAKIMRKELGLRGVKHLKVVYSEEQPVINTRTPGSASWVVGTAGLILAGEAIKDLISQTNA